MKKVKRAWLPLLLLSLMASLLIVLRSYLMDALIAPIAFLFWGLWRILASVDQTVYWIALIIFCAVLVGWLILSRKIESPNPAYNYEYKPPNRVEHWRALIEEGVLGKTERERLRKSMEDLVFSVLTQEARPGQPLEIAKRLQEKTTLSAAAYQYLFPQQREKPLTLRILQLDGAQFVPRWLRRWNKKYIHQNHALMVEILSWLESELEINNEKGQPGGDDR